MRKDHVLTCIIRPALQLLPEAMRSNEAELMLLAIGYQESKFTYRRKLGGPAKGFWQFEEGGVRAVLNHHRVGRDAEAVLHELEWCRNPIGVYQSLEWGDLIACCLARLLLYADPHPLPNPLEHPEEAWKYYTRTWRPGKPRREHWNATLEFVR